MGTVAWLKAWKLPRYGRINVVLSNQLSIMMFVTNERLIFVPPASNNGGGGAYSFTVAYHLKMT